jgi:hypothetical protein
LIAFALVSVLPGMIPFLVVPALRRWFRFLGPAPAPSSTFIIGKTVPDTSCASVFHQEGRK